MLLDTQGHIPEALHEVDTEPWGSQLHSENIHVHTLTILTRNWWGIVNSIGGSEKQNNLCCSLLKNVEFFLPEQLGKLK